RRRDARRVLAVEQVGEQEARVAAHLLVDLARIGAAALEAEAVEEQHALEEGESAGAVDDDTGDVVAAGDERRGDAAQAQAEDDDAPAVDLGRGGEALEGEAVVG